MGRVYVSPCFIAFSTVPSTAIASANVEVWHMFEAQQATQPTKRGLYAKFIPEEKAEVGKRAALPAEHGVVETVLGLHVCVRMGVANKIDLRKLFPRNICASKI